jgi:hypothetical protein
MGLSKTSKLATFGYRSIITREANIILTRIE